MNAPLKSLVVFGTGLLCLSGLLFYAEQNRRISQGGEGLETIQDVLKAQNQALAGRIFQGLNRAEADALAALERWRKRAKINSFLADTALSEPDAPKWIVVAGRRVRAAGVADDALLEDALLAHLSSLEKLALYQSRGKQFLFIRGTVEGHSFAAAYAPEAFFSSFRSNDGIRAWLALKNGTIVYHPHRRFIGSNASNLKPVAAAITELSAGRSAPLTRTYLGLEGRDTVGSWTPLPSFGLLVGSEWPEPPLSGEGSSLIFWLAVVSGLAGAVLTGMVLRGKGGAEPQLRAFDESRLDDDAMEYLEGVRAAAELQIQDARRSELRMREELLEREKEISAKGETAWKLSVLEEYQEKILPNVTGKQVWSQICELVCRRSPGLSLVFYRYSPSSFSLVPETVHGLLEIPEEAVSFLLDSRIFLGNPGYLPSVLETDAFQKWNSRRNRLMPGAHTEFRAYPIQCAGAKGAVLAFFDGRMNEGAELEPGLAALDSLLSRTATFCDSLGQLLQSMNAKGFARKAVAGSANSAGNQPRLS